MTNNPAQADLTEPDLDTLDYRNSFQISRAELFKLQTHKCSISGFKGERAAGRSPVKHHNRRIPVVLQAEHARFANLQRSTAYSDPMNYTRSRASRQADMRFLVTSHRATGGVVLAGSFGMAVRQEPVPYPFYDPKESFRNSTEWEQTEAASGKLSSIHQALKTDGWTEYISSNPKEPSYARWDLHKRITAAGEATSYLFTSRDLNRLQKRLGLNLAGYVVATEIEVTPGWNADATPNWEQSTNNVHIHFLLFLKDSSITEKSRRALLTALHGRWSRTVRQHGYRSTLSGSYLRPVRDTDADLNRAGRYLVKGTKPGSDLARLGGSFWDALRDSKDGDWKATNWWRQFEGAVRGRRLFRVSRSLMTTYGLTAERERRVEEWRASQPEPTAVIYIDRKSWFLMTSLTPELRTELLTTTEKGGVEATRLWLEAHQIPFHLEDGVDEAQPEKKVASCAA